MEGVCKIYEEQLKKDSSEQYLAFFSSLNIFSSLRIFGAQLLNAKKENSSQHSITYDISQLFDYIDNLT